MNEALLRAAVTTFEDLAFQFPMPELQAPPPGPSTAATVDFDGGRLVLAVSDTLLPSIAASMLGDEQPSREEQLDALKEVANVICGNVLPAVGERRMKAPRLGADDGGTPTAQVDVVLIDGSATVRLFLQ